MNTMILAGVGRMGGAMLAGWAANLDPDFRFFGLDPYPGAAANVKSAPAGASVCGAAGRRSA